MSITRNAYPARLRVIIVAAVLPIAGLLFAAGQAGSAHAAAARTTHASTATWAGGPEPTIVLVHGAWADASSWDGVIARLQADGFAAIAAPNPLRGLAVDSSYLADFLSSIQGPIVLVVGLTGAQPGSCLGSANAFTAVPYPGAAAGDFDTYLKTGSDVPYPGFAQCFANDLPAGAAAVLAATQSPIAFSAGSDPSGAPAWQTIPSWDVIGTADHVIPPAEQLFMAQRAGAHITEVNASHLSLISQTDTVTRVIRAAARATS